METRSGGVVSMPDTRIQTDRPAMMTAKSLSHTGVSQARIPAAIRTMNRHHRLHG
jgi:hypothetical protein